MKDKLYRSRRIKVFGGIAGGMSQYFNLDPIIIRVIFVVITIMHGVGLILYIILWIVIPEEPYEMAYQAPADIKEGTSPGDQTAQDTTIADQKKTHSGRTVAGIILIGIGLIFFIDRMFPSFDFRDVFPLIFVLLGGVLIWDSIKK
jgi:phage shock protein PspC (stress-responsive transcriptional regulator)